MPQSSAKMIEERKRRKKLKYAKAALCCFRHSRWKGRGYRARTRGPKEKRDFRGTQSFFGRSKKKNRERKVKQNRWEKPLRGAQSWAFGHLPVQVHLMCAIDAERRVRRYEGEKVTDTFLNPPKSSPSQDQLASLRRKYSTSSSPSPSHRCDQSRNLWGRPSFAFSDLRPLHRFRR